MLIFVDKTAAAATSFPDDDLSLINEPPTTKTAAAAIADLKTILPCRFTALNLLDPEERVKDPDSVSRNRSGSTVKPPMTSS